MGIPLLRKQLAYYRDSVKSGDPLITRDALQHVVNTVADTLTLPPITLPTGSLLNASATLTPQNTYGPFIHELKRLMILDRRAALSLDDTVQHARQQLTDLPQRARTSVVRQLVHHGFAPHPRITPQQMQSLQTKLPTPQDRAKLGFALLATNPEASQQRLRRFDDIFNPANDHFRFASGIVFKSSPRQKLKVIGDGVTLVSRTRNKLPYQPPTEVTRNDWDSQLSRVIEAYTHLPSQESLQQ